MATKGTGAAAPSRRTVFKAAGASAVALAVADRSQADAATSAPVSTASASGQRIAIIGSGYGGAVAARHLGEAGIQADMIEMGNDWRTMAPKSDGRVFDSMIGPTDRSTWFKTRTDMPFANFLGLPVVNQSIPSTAGVLDTKQYSQFKVYRGIGVGGGSLVNGGMAVTPRRSFLAQVLPQIDVDEMYATYFPRANAALGVATPPSAFLKTSDWYKFTRTSAAAVAKAGYAQVDVPNVYDWDYMQKETTGAVPASACRSGHPEVIFGNNYGKKSLDKTILKAALDTGKINLIPLTEVTSITQAADGTFVLSLKTIDFKGNVLARRDATYDRVIMGAGSVGTNELLVTAKAKGTITGLPETTGRSWGPNGNVMLAREAWVLGPDSSVGGNESGIPAQGVMAWDDSARSVFAEVAPMPVGIDTYTNLYLALTNNPNLGAFTWTGSGVDLTWSPQMHAPSVAAAKAVFDKINAAANSFYRTDLFEKNKTMTDYFTYHPLGGMVLGESTDLSGEVLGVPGLFIMDGSLVPGKLGVNPFVTITALAERNMDRLMAAGRFS